MAHLDSQGIDELNASDILQPSANENVSLPSEDDFLKGLISDDENEAENTQKPADTNNQSTDLIGDDDTGLPDSLFLNDDDQNGQPEQFQLDNFENSKPDDEVTLPEDQTQPDQIDNLDNLDQQENHEQIENQENVDQLGNNEQVENQENIDQPEEQDQQPTIDHNGLDAQNDAQQEEIDNNNLNDQNNESTNNLNSESDNGVEILTPTKETNKKTESPKSRKSMPKYNSKSFQDFIKRNDHSVKRHNNPELERLPSPKTIRYTSSLKEPTKAKEIPDLRSKRVQEIYDEGLKKGPCNSNYPLQVKNDSENKTSTPTSPRQSQNNQQKEIMSEASTILANSKFDRIIDLTVGKKANLTKTQTYGILRKFFIKGGDDRKEVLKRCGGDDENDKEQENDDNNNESNNENNNDDENNNEKKDENKTYNAESLKSILKQAASSEGGDSFIRKIRPIVRAALFDMKQPIVSPMTQKQRAAMNFDKTLEASLKKQPTSPTH